MNRRNKLLAALLVSFSTIAVAPVEEVQAAEFAILGNLEYPAMSQSIVSDFLNISGWAIGTQGISKTKVYIDGTFVGDAVYGFERKDVNAAFPNYLNSLNSAFTYKIPLSKLNDGNHNVRVDIIGVNGKTGYLTSSFTTKKVDKLQPRMWIETPETTIKTNGESVRFSGWALNDGGVKEVKVYVDDKYIANAPYGFERKDVEYLYSGYTNGANSGFLYNLDTSLLSRGLHKITVEAIGNDGVAQRMDKYVESIIPPPIHNLDAPASNLQTSDFINVAGWAVNNAGINAVSVFIDDKYVGNATYGLDRPDVQNVYPVYKNAAKSGFTFQYDAASLPNGSHKVSVSISGKDGTTQSSTRYINVAKKQPMTHLDSIYNGLNINKDSIDIVGWAISDSVVQNVSIFLDGAKVGEAVKGSDRPDVQAAFKDYRYSRYSGFSYKLNTSKLSIGKHTIMVQANGADGTKTEETFTVNMAGVVNYKTYSNTLDYYANIQFNKNNQINYDPITKTWRVSTKDEIVQFMNPTNYVNDTSGKYMFLKLSYFEGVTEAQLNTLLKGKGVLEGKGGVFLSAGKQANVNPIYLVAHALLETGNGTSSLATGKLTVDKLYIREKVVDETGTVTYVPKLEKEVEAKPIYNMYGIGAYDSDANLWGADKAYREGWFSIDSAIIGGAKWIANGYISAGQDTLYKMRWDFSTSTMWHQYATDIQWAYKQTSRIKTLIDMLDKPVLVFEVPNFKEPEVLK